MNLLRKAIANFIFLTPLQALEFVMGLFMVGTGLWVIVPSSADAQLGHPLLIMLAVGHLNPILMGICLVIMGFIKSLVAFLDTFGASEAIRKIRVGASAGSLLVWTAVLIAGVVAWPSALWYRYGVLLGAELWTIVTGAHSRPGPWR